MAFQLRYLQTLSAIAAEKQSTIFFPVPIDIMQNLGNLSGDSLGQLINLNSLQENQTKKQIENKNLIISNKNQTKSSNSLKPGIKSTSKFEEQPWPTSYDFVGQSTEHTNWFNSNNDNQSDTV